MKKLLLGILLMFNFGIYFWISQWVEREEFALFFGLFSVLFGIYIFLMKTSFSPKLLFGVGLVNYLILVFCLPWLSQDFYRFLWDGFLLQAGENPYLFTPNQMMASNNLELAVPEAEFHLEKMGELSASNYTNYPPISQWIYYIASFFAEKSLFTAVVFMKSVLLVSALVTLYFSQKILGLLKLPVKNAYWFFLNPLILIESVGNLHFEILMLAFFTASVYYLLNRKYLIAGSLFGLSVATKLITLVFAVFLIHYLAKHKNGFRIKNYVNFFIVKFSFTFLLVVLLCYSFFIDQQMLQNYQESLGLWFTAFEFNASIYYLFRWIGFQWYGYNMIAVTGKIMFALSSLSLLFFAFQQTSKKYLFKWMFFGFAFYLIFSTTVHPWYLSTLVLLGVFTHFKSAILWSYLVMLSYVAYAHSDAEENTWLLGFQYVLFFGLFIYETSVFYRKIKDQK
ncbi:mannosyltransferase [Psychroflexus maritimus]|uniref:Mannosyltransferase n=1 Tax=Psychroflexus maritimus TaxID=2714865 RepID=A0A967AKC2_9FLAO|nr:mannosyltransferase [Psychroflexus maritimus]NGZ89924.1 mannosyltransferase [Psychroflexus maritimus]